MKKNLLITFFIIAVNLLYGCSSKEDAFAGDSVTDVIGTWEYVDNGVSNCYVFKSNSAGMFVRTKYINSNSYVLEHYDFNYTYHVNSRQIELITGASNGNKQLVLDDVRIVKGTEFAFRLNGMEISTNYSYNPRWSLEVNSIDLERKDGDYGVAYSCDRVGGEFIFKIAPLYIWHEDVNDKFNISVENEYPKDVLVSVEVVAGNSHLYKINVRKVRTDTEAGHYLSISAINNDETISLSGKLVINQNGAICNNPTFVGTWNRLSYEYKKENGYVFVFRKDGTGMRVVNPGNFFFNRKSDEFVYSYNSSDRSLVMEFQNEQEEIKNVSFSQNGDSIYGVLQSDQSKIKLGNLERAICTLKYRCLDMEPKYDGDKTPVFICDRDSNTTLHFEITPDYYWHDAISEKFDIKVTSDDFTDGKSSFSITQGTPSILIVKIPKAEYRSFYRLLLEKPWTDLSYNSLTPLSIRSEYVYKQDTDKPKPDTGNPASNPDWEELEAEGERYFYCPIKKTKSHVESWKFLRIKAYKNKISGQIIIYYVDRHYAHIGTNRKVIDDSWHSYLDQYGHWGSCRDEEVLEGVIYNKVKEK